MAYHMPSGWQRGWRLVAAWAALFVSGVCCAGGCAAFCHTEASHRKTACGEVRIGYPARRHLSVLKHTYRRDDLGRLVVFARFRNASHKSYAARLRVKFWDRQGRLVKDSHETDRLEPGETALEWTSYTADAARYAVEVTGRKFALW